MNNQERKRLLRELDLLEELARKRKVCCYYTTIFSFYKEGVPPWKISKKTGVSVEVITKLTRGTWHLPKIIIPLLKDLGFKICSCCGARVVPITPIRNTTLTQLCSSCWLSSGNQDPVYPNKSCLSPLDESI